VARVASPSVEHQRRVPHRARRGAEHVLSGMPCSRVDHGRQRRVRAAERPRCRLRHMSPHGRERHRSLGDLGGSPECAPTRSRGRPRSRPPVACGGCHEFRFPGVSGDDERHLMQSTMREHARSPAAAKACATCHMPAVGPSRRSHTFCRGPRSRVAPRQPAGTGRARRRRRRAHHAPPTGAWPRLSVGRSFRRLEVGVAYRSLPRRPLRRGARSRAADREHLRRRPR